jgi:hypothetical protein
VGDLLSAAFLGVAALVAGDFEASALVVAALVVAALVVAGDFESLALVAVLLLGILYFNYRVFI